MSCSNNDDWLNHMLLATKNLKGKNQMQPIVFIHIILTWFFSGMSLLTLITGYHDPVMLIIAGVFALGAAGFAAMGKAYID